MAEQNLVAVYDTAAHADAAVRALEQAGVSSNAIGRHAQGGASGTAAGAGAAMDRTLGTNLSGANPGAEAPDGTPGNPKGTMVGRGVDEALGTDVSGTKPGRK